jgi:hypothetical protein
MPGERSPEYVTAAWHVRAGVDAIQVPRTRMPWRVLSSTTSEMPMADFTGTLVTLRRYRFVAPCPYVGEKAWYAWWIWLDDHGQGWADTTVERVIQSSH